MEDYYIALPRSGVTVDVRKNTAGPPDVVVILLGFMGSNQSQLRKFADVYMHFFSRSSKSGCVVALTPPVSFILSKGMTSRSTSSSDKDQADQTDQNGYGSLASDLIELSTASERQNSRIILHVMSQNGIFAYQQIMRLSNLEWKSRLLGICYDSAPVEVTYDAVSTALIAAFGKVLGNIIIWGMTKAQGGKANLDKALEELQKDNVEFYGANEFLVSEVSSRVPRLFVFSSSDTVSSDVYIRSVIKSMEDQNVEVQKLVLESSSHMQVSLILFPIEWGIR
jgi:hypothetical protein